MSGMRKIASTGLLVVTLLSSCASGVSGAWTGRMVSPNSVGVRFVLDDQAGKLTGQVFWEDPSTHSFEFEGGLNGTRNDSSASWTTDGEVTITGRFSGNTFVGTVTFPAAGSEPARRAELTLVREASSATRQR